MARQRAVTEPAQELPGYGELLEALKARIRGAQVRALLAMNRELIALYWDIGRAIVGRQQSDEWGTSVIERLSRDLRAAFPDAHGFSPRNLWRMRRFHLAYAGPELPSGAGAGFPTRILDVRSVFLPRAVAEIGGAPADGSEPDAPRAILPQPVAETAAPAAGASDVAIFEILPQPVAEIADPAAEARDAAVLFEILPQAVAEILDAGSSALYRSFEGAILPQPVAEIPASAAEGSDTSNAPTILPQAVAEIPGGGPSFVVPNDESANLPQAVAELPWGHNIVLLEKLRSRRERLWYAAMAGRHGWSRNVLVHQIETRLHARSGRAVTNFERTIPAADSDLVRELLKDPYHFGFVQLGAAVHERDLERALLSNVQHFLMELGLGFALIGSQYHLEVGGQDYYLDLLFFHVNLRRYVVVELKIGAFQPEDAGKMNFYLSALDELVRGSDHEPSIGLILCKERNRVVAEYALRGSTHPIGVAEFQLMERLPEPLRAALPSVREIERRLKGEAAFGA